MTPAATLPSALIAGKYRVIRLLGTGGMSLVFEAHHELTGKRVAVKRLRPQFAERPEHVQRMLREAQACARIRHPNVVDVYDVASEGDTLFLVMEYLEGETLAAHLARGPLSLPDILELMIPAMRGVAAGHASGIVHRDIKPDNIFLARVTDHDEVVPKVLDFGISKLSASSADELSLTASGTTLGTPLYMSYEQLNGARDIDARSDVYAFGAILYEALTGRTPYRAETLGSLVVQVATTTPPRPSELCPDLPPDFDGVVMRALARSRDARFDSLDAVIAAVSPFRKSRRLVTTGDSHIQRVVPPRSRPWAMLLIAAGVLVASALASLWQPRAPVDSATAPPVAAVSPTQSASPIQDRSAPSPAPPAAGAPSPGLAAQETTQHSATRPTRAVTQRARARKLAPSDEPPAAAPVAPAATSGGGRYRAEKPTLDEF